MFKFFRTVRRGLLAESRFSRYFLYAIGEIILVVIGILIALQINNWNEARKLRAQEHQLLADLRSDMLESRKELKDMIRFNDSTIYFYKYILDQLKTNHPPDEQFQRGLGMFTSWDSPYLTYTAYEALKNKGLDIVQNRTLKKQIVSLYETSFANLVSDYDKAEWIFYEAVTVPLANKMIRRVIGYSHKGVPTDYSGMKANEEFVNALHQLIRLRSNGVRVCKDVIDLIDTLVRAIDKELNASKNNLP
jgi:hypothetical protein